jgi:SET domain-containing protein
MCVHACVRADEQLGVDGYHAGNELRYINDYRTDISSFDDEAKQERSANVEVTQVYVDGKPHVITVTSKTVKKNAELLVDYGDEL